MVEYLADSLRGWALVVGHVLEEQGACHAPYVRPVTARGSVYRVLLLEDDDIDAKLVSFSAAAIDGFRLDIERVVSSGDARARLASGAFDLCILDFWLGCESSIRFLTELSGTPALVLTSLSTPDIRQMCVTAGAAVFLGKADLNERTLRDGVLKALEAEETAPLFAASDSTPAGRPAARPVRTPGRLAPAVLRSTTETVRFGMFETFWADGSEAETNRPIDVRAFILGAVESARGLLDERDQSLDIGKADVAVLLSRDRAGFFFLLFEVLARASSLSAPRSTLAVALVSDDREIRIDLQGGPRIDSTAGALALGPLCTQLLADQGAVFSDNTDPDGRFLLTIRFAVERDAALSGAAH